MTAIKTHDRLARAKRARRAKRTAGKRTRYLFGVKARVDERALINASNLPTARRARRAIDRALKRAVARARRTVATVVPLPADDAELALMLGIGE